MPEYKVLSPGFWGGTYRTPGGRHDPVVTASPIAKKDLPSWLEPITGPAPAKRAAAKKTAAAKKEQETEAKLDFTGDDDVETL